MKARKLKSGRWNVRANVGTEGGKIVYRSITANTKQEALRKATEAEAKGYSPESVQEACERFLAARRSELSPSTLRGYEGTLRAYILPDKIGAVKVASLSSAILQDWVNRMPVSRKTKKNHLGFLMAAIRFCDVEKAFRVRIAQTEPREMYTPTIEEVNLVLDVSDDELRRAIVLACFGLRRGEICALSADDLDRRNCRVRVSKAYAKAPDGSFVLKAPKTMKSRRVVPVTQGVMDLMPKEGPVVSCSPDAITLRFRKAVARAGVHHFRFHDLRSFFASIALSSAIGAGARSVQDLGGWQTDRVMKSHYERSMSDQKKKDVDAILDWFGRNLKAR